MQTSKTMSLYGFNSDERALFRRLTTPAKIQRFLDELDYNLEPNGPTCFSPRRAIEFRRAHCMEGALFGAAALRMLGREPLLLDLEAVRDTDHVLAIFRDRGCWGAVAKSNYSGLRFREPVYRTLRELSMSYFEHYFNPAGEKTLRRFSRPVNLKRFDRMGWTTSHEDVWAIPEYLLEISHTPLLTREQERSLNRMDPRLRAAGEVGTAK